MHAARTAGEERRSSLDVKYLLNLIRSRRGPLCICEPVGSVHLFFFFLDLRTSLVHVGVRLLSGSV